MNGLYSYVSVTEAAISLGVTKWAVYKVLESGRVPTEYLVNISKGHKKPRYSINTQFISWYRTNRQHCRRAL